jgi:hypothetical protein
MPKEFIKLANKYRKEHKGRLSLWELKLLWADFKLKRALSKPN